MSSREGERSQQWRWGVCGLLLLATMLNYMDRLTLSQSATDLSRELSLSNEDYGKLEQGFGLAFAMGGIAFGFVADRVSLRWLYPAVLVAWSAAGFATGWARGFNDLMICRVLLAFFEAGQWPCALTASQRLLSRRDRAFGNSVLQSGASLGAVITPLVVQALVSDRAGSWRAPFQIIGLLGIAWTVVWLFTIRGGDLARSEPGTAGSPEISTTTRGTLIRRFLVLAFVAISINLCWHFYRAWLPKMLREQHAYHRSTVNYFTAAFYIASDVGCLGAGFFVRFLSARGRSVHASRMATFFGCALLTALGTLVSGLHSGPFMLGLLLFVAAGALGLFPIYYSLSQELSTRHQGKITGLLGCIAWLSSAPMHSWVGRWVDQTGSYTSVQFVTGLLPLGALAVLLLFWDREPASVPAVSAATGSTEPA